MRVEVSPQGSTVHQVTQEIYFVNKADKPELLKTILNEYKGSILVFSRTKFGAKKIAHVVRATGHTSSEIHSNRSLNQRFEALEGFKIGKYRVLVATDIAARGIDVKGIELVVNYDLPENASDYVHRIGRTGRAGHTGHAISLATHDQRNDVRSIERLIKKTLPVKALPKLAAPAPVDRFSQPERERRPFGGHGRRGDRFASRSSAPRPAGRSFSRPGGAPSSNRSFARPSRPTSYSEAEPSQNNRRDSKDRRPSYRRNKIRKMDFGDEVTRKNA